jgi:hypothetical protein
MLDHVAMSSSCWTGRSSVPLIVPETQRDYIVSGRIFIQNCWTHSGMNAGC